jgi:hypothetical protein
VDTAPLGTTEDSKTKMSGEKRAASFGSSQLVKRARPDGNGNEVATINGAGGGALIHGVSMHARGAFLRILQLAKATFEGRGR